MSRKNEAAALFATIRNTRSLKRRHEEAAAEAGSSERDDLDRVLAEPVDKALFRMEAMNELLQDTIASKRFSLHSEAASGVKDNEAQHEQVKRMLEVVEAHIERSTHYRKLLGTFCFFVCYCGLLVSLDHGAGASISRRYEVESSIMNGVVKKIPNGGGAGAFATTEDSLLPTDDDFYAWMKEAVVGAFFRDTVCGDGICDTPEEYQGFGRFGCSKDCNAWRNVTKIDIDLRDMIALSGKLPFAQKLDHSVEGWDFSGNQLITSRNFHKYKWNIYSKTMQVFFGLIPIPLTRVVLTMGHNAGLFVRQGPGQYGGKSLQFSFTLFCRFPRGRSLRYPLSCI